MCGIAGFWFKDSAPESARKWLRDSAKSLHHRGPDDSGLWFDGAVGLGHTRLSILDLSPLGHQPMASRDGRWVMAFNGEVYNFREIRKDLERLNHSFAGTSDSEVVIEAFAECGPAGTGLPGSTMQPWPITSGTVMSPSLDPFIKASSNFAPDTGWSWDRTACTRSNPTGACFVRI